MYDLRTNQYFTLHQNPIDDPDVKDFVESCRPDNRAKRKENERFKRFTYDELIARDKANLPDPDIIAAEIVEDLEAPLAQFATIAADLKK